jgi:hypothetical protein
MVEINKSKLDQYMHRSKLYRTLFESIVTTLQVINIDASLPHSNFLLDRIIFVDQNFYIYFYWNKAFTYILEEKCLLVRLIITRNLKNGSYTLIQSPTLPYIVPHSQNFISFPL